MQKTDCTKITNESGIMLSLGYLWHDVSHLRTYDSLIKWLCLFEAVTIEQRCIINMHFKANILNMYMQNTLGHIECAF